MNDESKLDQLFQGYRAACPDVDPSTNFMPELWQRIENRYTFGSVFQTMARTAVSACAALCALLLLLNFVQPLHDGMAQAPNYTDALVAEHNDENTNFTENFRSPNPVEESTSDQAR